MTIELNKTYRTRSGQKCRIICVDRNTGEYPYSQCPIVGLVQCPNGELIHLYFKDGASAWPPNPDYASSDLISEWIDRPTIDWNTLPWWHKYVAMQKDGRWYSYADSPHISGDVWHVAQGGWLYLPPEYAPKWEGDWKESLITRDDSIVEP